MRAGAKLAPNLRTKEPTFGVLAAEALAWSTEHRPKDIRTLTGRMKVLTEEFGALAAALVISTCTGIVMAWKYARRRSNVLAVIAAGVLVPCVLLFL